MSTRNVKNRAVVVLAAVSLCSCGVSTGAEARKPLPVSTLQYHLELDPASLPDGVVARERRVPGTTQLQTWIRNESDIPYVIITLNRQGTVIRRQKMVDRKTYLETPAVPQASGKAEAAKWQLLEGAEEILIMLQYTPDAIVAGREYQASQAIEVPPPEPFSIQATFGGEATPIRGQLIYSATPPKLR